MLNLPTKEIRDHLRAMDIWTISDLKHYIQVSQTLEKKEKVFFFEKAITFLSYYEDYDHGIYESMFVEIYSNHIQDLLINDGVPAAKNCFEDMKVELVEKKSADFEITVKCLEIIIGLHTDYDHWLPEAENLIDVIKYINYKNTHMIEIIIYTHLI